MNALEDDEHGEVFGLSYEATPRPLLASVGGGATCRLKQSTPYGASMGQDETGGGYDDLFGEETAPPALDFCKPNLQKMESLGHEPLFPDVDEEKIKPTVGLGSTAGTNTARSVAAPKEEFTIVLDQGGSDSRYGGGSNVPVADWVVPSGHNRREPVLVRQGGGHHSIPAASRPSGLHSGGLHGPMHGRNIGHGSGGSRSVRSCNPDLEPEFPSRAASDQALKLPGQTRVTPDEYKEFLGLGHGEIFNLDLDRVVDPPWRAPGSETSDFFNYGLDEGSWKDYCKAIECHRQEFSMKKKIQTYESSNPHYQQDPDLPPEVAAAIAAEAYHMRSGHGPEMTKALPIPVFQGADDYSLRNRRGRDFRRPEVRYDPEVILELAGGVEPSTGINTDYGEEYIDPFGPSDARTADSKPGHKSSSSVGQRSLPPKGEQATRGAAGGGDEADVVMKGPTDDASAMFKDDEDFGNRQAKEEALRPGDLAMGMETDSQASHSWSGQKMMHPGAPPRPDFGRMYDPYASPYEMWRPVYHGRGWRPRGPPEYWGGRGYVRTPDGGRGGRYWPPYGPRRPGRRPFPMRYYDEYRPAQYPPWARREDRPPPPLQDHHAVEESKSSGRPERPRDAFSPPDHGSYRERERRRHSVEREEERSRSSYPRSRGREYDAESRSFGHHRDRSRDYGRSHRREEYEDRHRDKKRRGKSSERESRRRYSKERSRGRDRDDRRSRRYDTSDSESDSRNRSKDRE